MQMFYFIIYNFFTRFKGKFITIKLFTTDIILNKAKNIPKETQHINM